MSNKAVFLDRDGTIAKDVHYCRRPEDFELFPCSVKAIRILNERRFKVIVTTNQSGIGRGYFTEETLAQIHEKMKREFAKEGAWIDDIYYCPHHPDDNCECRKPKPGLLLQAAKELGIDLSQSWMVGDELTDVKAGKSAGCRTILLGGIKCELCHLMDEEDKHPDFIAPNLLEAAKLIGRWVEQHADGDYQLSKPSTSG